VRLRRVAASVAALVVAGPLLGLGAAWFATPGVGDLARRVELRPRGERGRVLALGSITPMTVDALVATEDERYWRNSGIDVIGLLRAIPYDVTHLSLAQGGSTLTEQLAKNLWLGGNDGNIWAKLKDMALALKLGRSYSKTAVLQDYLGTAYFGEGGYGIDAASRRYFGVAPRSLDAAQATLLVGLVQAPTSYDPYTHPAASRERQVDVLRSLVRVGKLSDVRARQLLAEPLHLADGRRVPGIAGVDLSAGPAVAWRDLSVAVAALLAGVAAVIVHRLGRIRHPLVARAAAIAGFCLLAAGLVAAVRSFRVV
jgi:membrane peptidoglycan carboxypeptidase